MAFGAFQSAFLAVMCSAMDMIMNAGGQTEPFTNRLDIDKAVEVDPLAAVVGPRLPTKGLGNAGGDDGVFEKPEMFTGHESYHPSEYCDREIK
jgi:hypothetical protein